MSDILWSEKTPVEQTGNPNPVDVKIAQGFEDRFLLYQTADMIKKIPTMWILLDRTTGTQHMLYGEGWEGAELKAGSRIPGILSKGA